MSNKVLICDDDIYVVEVLKMLVEKEGYEALIAYDGVKALDMACKEVPEAMILDLKMPGKSGYEICTALKGNQRTKEIFIMILTGRSLYCQGTGAMETSPDCLLTKPVAPKKLRRKLHEIFNQ
ncbi:MAG: response regulator [bacterium]|nr:response regulator [bacterium]